MNGDNVDKLDNAVLSVADSTANEPGPGGFDRWNAEHYVSPWHDQKSQMFFAFPTQTYTASSLSHTFTLPEAPLWWVVCVQTYQQNTADVALITVEQNPGDGQSFDSISPPAATQTGGVQRFITKSKGNQLTVKFAAALGVFTSGLVNVYACGLGVDPSKVGLF